MIGADAVVPLVSFDLERPALQTTCRVQVIAERGDQLEDAWALLADLDQAWGPDGELESLVDAEIGVAVPVSWESVLLLGRVEPAGWTVDVGAHSVTRVAADTGGVGPGWAGLPEQDARHALAAELITCELIASSCLAVRVQVGPYLSSANRGIRADFAGA